MDLPMSKLCRFPYQIAVTVANFIRVLCVISNTCLQDLLSLVSVSCDFLQALLTPMSNGKCLIDTLVRTSRPCRHCFTSRWLGRNANFLIWHNFGGERPVIHTPWRLEKVPEAAVNMTWCLILRAGAVTAPGRIRISITG